MSDLLPDPFFAVVLENANAFLENPDLFSDPWEVEQAWHRWQVESCIERNGEHLWELEIEPFEVWGQVDLSCSYCPASVHDLYADGVDCIQGEVDGIGIEDGHHRSLLPWTGPVRVKPVLTHYPANPSHGDEWDFWIEVTNV